MSTRLTRRAGLSTCPSGGFWMPAMNKPHLYIPEYSVLGSWLSEGQGDRTPKRRRSDASLLRRFFALGNRERTRRSSDQRVHRNPVTLVTPIVRYPALNLFQIIYDHNNHTLLRRMLLRRDSLRIHSRTDYDASLSLSRLPAIQWRSVFVFRHRADGSFQALARLATLPCLAQ